MYIRCKNIYIMCIVQKNNNILKYNRKIVVYFNNYHNQNFIFILLNFKSTKNEYRLAKNCFLLK